MIAGEAQARDAPARDIAKTNSAAGGKNTCKGSAAGVRGSKNAADAGACDVRYGDVILLEDLQHTEVREPAGESATQGESDAWARGGVHFGGFGNRFHHKASFAIATESGQWTVGSEIPVPMYCLKSCTATDALCANSTKILVPYPRCTIGARNGARQSDSRRNAVL